MTDEISAFHRFVSLCDDVLELGKDFSILLLVVLFLFFGTFLRKKLDDLGIQELGPLKLTEVQQQNQDAKDAALQASTVDQKISDLQLAFDKVSKENPGVARQIEPLRQEVTALNAQMSSADKFLKTTLLSQQDVLSKASVQTVQNTGWIYVGHEDEAKQAWSGIGPKNLSPPPATPTFQIGQTLILGSDVFVHSSPPSGDFHNQGDVVGAWSNGARVQVVDQDVSHAKSGGWFIWLKVQRLGS